MKQIILASVCAGMLAGCADSTDELEQSMIMKDCANIPDKNPFAEAEKAYQEKQEKMREESRNSRRRR